MSRFHLYSAADGAGYLLDLQTDYLQSYTTRVVAPVVPLSSFEKPAQGLNPLITLDGETLVVLTHFMSAVPASALKTRVADVSAQADEFTRALDLLFQGY